MAKADDEDRAGELLIQEVDEDLRRDQYLSLWKRYGGFAIAAAVGIVIAVAGYQGWQGWQASQRREEAARFGAAQALADDGKTKEAEAAFAKIAEDGTRGFAAIAGMRRAELLAKDGDTAGAEAAYDQIAASAAAPLMRDLAVLKGAMVGLDGKGDLEAVKKRLAPLATRGAPWYYQATELTALIDRKEGDEKHATELFKQLADDAQAPQGVRARATELLAALAPPSDGAAAPAAKAPAASAASSPAPAEDRKTQDDKGK